MKIKISYSVVTPESAEIGDFAETGWENQEGETLETVHDAAIFLITEGAKHASSSAFHPGIWYETNPELDYQDMSEKTLAFHLYDFSEDDQAWIFERVTGKKAVQS